MPLRHLAWAPLLAISLLGACDRSAPVRVRAHLAARTPLAGLEIALVPFDPDALLDSLLRAASGPRPAFPDLERELLGYQPGDDSAAEKAARTSSAAAVASAATRDSVLKLSAELRRMDRTAPGYRSAYARFRDL